MCIPRQLEGKAPTSTTEFSAVAKVPTTFEGVPVYGNTGRAAISDPKDYARDIAQVTGVKLTH